MLTTARKLAGEPIAYADEVEACYGVRPRRFEQDEFEAAHRRLDEVVPGNGPLLNRCVSWRESRTVPVDRLEAAIASLAEDLRDRTQLMFGLPDGESVDFELVAGKPWSGFNYYLGGLRSRVAINTDLPVLSTSLGPLVAHEAYPGHHTEHVRKEVGLLRRNRCWEESIVVIGTPHNLLSEGLADLGFEVVMGPCPDAVVADHLTPLGIRYDSDVVAAMRKAREALGGVRANAAFRLWEDGADPDTVIDEVARFELTSRARAQKAVEFLLHPIWRSYISCYVEGLALCRAFVGGDPARFARLVTEQLTPRDLIDEIAAGAIATGTAGRCRGAAARGRGVVVPSVPCPSVPAICPAGPACRCRDPTRAFSRRPRRPGRHDLSRPGGLRGAGREGVGQGKGGRRDPQPRLG